MVKDSAKSSSSVPQIAPSDQQSVPDEVESATPDEESEETPAKKLERMRERRKLIEKENKRKKEILAQTIAARWRRYKTLFFAIADVKEKWARVFVPSEPFQWPQDIQRNDFYHNYKAIFMDHLLWQSL